jgi:hypothetical protein
MPVDRNCCPRTVVITSAILGPFVLTTAYILLIHSYRMQIPERLDLPALFLAAGFGSYTAFKAIPGHLALRFSACISYGIVLLFAIVLYELAFFYVVFGEYF